MRQFMRMAALLVLSGLVSACIRAPAPPPGPMAGAVSAQPTAGQAATAVTALPSRTPAEAPTAALALWPTPLPAASDPVYWPTDGWRTSTPEEQGMDSNILAAMIETITQQKLDIHGIVLVRHGYILAEVYFHPYSGEIPHELASATKSFTGALAGIAAGEGKIKGPSEKVLSFFPDRTVANPDPRKDAMTLRDLLTMRTGQYWAEWNMPFASPKNDATQMGKTHDWVGYVLDRPMAGTPGLVWNYNSGASHVLSAIVGHATGESEAQYAGSHLFDPLGISDFIWSSDPQGVTTGYAGLRLRPRDMAKFGFLYLHGGRWDGRQVVPGAWVRASLERPESGGTAYGYQMWLGDSGRFDAAGMGGQLIWVDPGADLVGVVVSGLPEALSAMPQDLLASYARRAVKSDGPLPADPAGQARLAAAQRAAASPKPQPVTPGPEDIARDSARYCTWSTNPFGVVGGSTTFGEGAEATSHICFAQGCVDFKVGLDGVFRVNDWGGQRMAMRGAWEDGRKFVLQSQLLGQPGREDLRFVPAGDTTQIIMQNKVTGETAQATCTTK